MKKKSYTEGTVISSRWINTKPLQPPIQACDLMLMLKLSLLAHPSCTCMEYCKFQRTSSMEGRSPGTPAVQLRAISATVLRESTAKVPRMAGSAMSFSNSGSSASASLICEQSKAQKMIKILTRKKEIVQTHCSDGKILELEINLRFYGLKLIL
jgi:hypothetical protein